RRGREDVGCVVEILRLDHHVVEVEPGGVGLTDRPRIEAVVAPAGEARAGRVRDHQMVAELEQAVHVVVGLVVAGDVIAATAGPGFVSALVVMRFGAGTFGSSNASSSALRWSAVGTGALAYVCAWTRPAGASELLPATPVCAPAGGTLPLKSLPPLVMRTV